MSNNSFPPPPAKLKWYKRKRFKLPVWLWIVGIFMVAASISEATKVHSEETTVADSVPLTTVAPQTTVSSSSEATTNLNPLGGNSPEYFYLDRKIHRGKIVLR